MNCPDCGNPATLYTFNGADCAQCDWLDCDRMDAWLVSGGPVPADTDADRTTLLNDVCLWADHEIVGDTLTAVALDAGIVGWEDGEQSCDDWVCRCWERCLSSQIENANPSQIAHYMAARNAALLAE